MAENDNTAKRDAHRQALKDSTRWVCVLSDGETFDGLSGSWIAQTPNNFDEDNNLEDQIPADNRIDLRGLLHWAIDQGYLDEDEDENPTMEVFMLIDDAHAHSAFEPRPADDPGIETFRSAEQAKAYATEWVNRQLAESGQPPMAIEWAQDERGVFPMNLPNDVAVSYFQILRAKSGPEFPAEEYFRQRGR